MRFARRLTCGRVCFEAIFAGDHQTPLRRVVNAGTLLEIDNLSVEFATESGALRAVAGVSLSVGAGRALRCRNSNWMTPWSSSFAPS